MKSSKKSKPFKSKCLYLLAFAFVMFSIKSTSAVFTGDDYVKLFPHRDAPYPALHEWIGNRLIDDFFAGFTFQVVSKIYIALPDILAPEDFLSIFSFTYGITFSAAATLLLFVYLSTSPKPDPRSGTLVFFFFLISGCAFTFGHFRSISHSYHTMLFAYLIPFVITIAFLFLTYPPRLLGVRMSTALNSGQCKKSHNKILGMIALAYLTAIGLEVYVIFSFIYIFTYLFFSVLISQKRQGQPKIRLEKCTPIIFKQKTQIIILFTAFSLWAAIALKTSGRTQTALSNKTTAGEVQRQLSIRDVTAAIEGTTTEIVLETWLYTLIGLLLIHPVLLKLNKTKQRKEALELKAFQIIFTLTVAALYLGFLIFFSSAANNPYITRPDFILPVGFLTLTSIGLLYASISVQTENLTILSIPIVFAGVLMFGEMRGELERSNVRISQQALLKTAYAEMAASQTDTVILKFGESNIPIKNSYPYLPGPNPAPWFQESFGLFMNQYYGTSFTESNPVTTVLQNEGN